jgi:hypothetical protein
MTTYNRNNDITTETNPVWDNPNIDSGIGSNKMQIDYWMD